jgi:hypothetical protein
MLTHGTECNFLTLWLLALRADGAERTMPVRSSALLFLCLGLFQLMGFPHQAAVPAPSDLDITLAH